jgi:hypothetical protein
MLNERIAPLAAVGVALAALACCVPLGLAGALGVFMLGGFFDAFEPYFLTAATFLLAVGAFQIHQAQKSCRRVSLRFSLAVLGLSGTVVVGVLLFPQTVAGLIADYIL